MSTYTHSHTQEYMVSIATAHGIKVSRILNMAQLPNPIMDIDHQTSTCNMTLCNLSVTVANDINVIHISS